MLSDNEITNFKIRINEVLGEGRLTTWQRDFLHDMCSRFDRYGTKTRLTDKQLGMLRRLTKTEDRTLYQRLAPAQDHVARRSGPQKRRGRNRGWRHREVKWAFFLLVILVMGIGQMISHVVGPQGAGTPDPVAVRSNFSSQNFTVTDGDTVRLADGTPVRLVGFNTPEKFDPLCSQEADLGKRASERLKQLVSEGTSVLTKVPCACAPGTEGTKKCNYGRSCGILRVDGQDVGQTLIAEGLAVSFKCGKTKCPKLPRPWCG